MNEPKNPIEYYGSPEGMPQSILDSKLAALNAEIETLRAERARRAALTSTEALADRLHRLLHFGVDCDYYYSKWPTPSGCRGEFHALADQMERWYGDREGRDCGDRPLGGLVALLERARFGRAEGKP